MCGQQTDEVSSGTTTISLENTLMSMKMVITVLLTASRETECRKRFARKAVSCVNPHLGGTKAGTRIRLDDNLEDHSRLKLVIEVYPRP